MKSHKLLFSVIFTSVFFVVCAWGESTDHLGTLKLDQLFLEPTFSTDERHFTQGFSIGNSFLGARWELDKVISGGFLLGSKRLLNRPARYGTESSNLSIVEAYGQLDTGLGIIQVGQIKIPFGIYGLLYESEVSFSETMFDQSRYIQLRDMGFKYWIEHDDFITTFAVHNGESDADTDHRYFMTARWAYLGPAKSEVGLSGSTGRWLDAQTNIEQEIRMGNVFAGFKIYGLGLAAEISTIEIFERTEFLRQAHGWHVDLEHPLWPQTGLMLRYDFHEPSHAHLNDQMREVSYGIKYFSKYQNSVFNVLAATRWEEGVGEPHTSAQVVWKLSPSIKP